ncbi:hypothetical protein Emtol_0362 [Emticicia oligotrophica DSM 17448]|uniref:Lipocalin-like domain-containing protein n=1 Tax=Emticicia oligotrophica (strain DSM 17448 / CIP 109782 / MTCC 6937 / GPTSA100-15) TaxID=929562 RepID=A0ABM5MWQ1_EMTOG|nr:hypothetical protein [Emticicia oligotrophica]AFK01516.1 hypothetical protein Emtol_0362 [Emticicia oligotrophica DSM 17448]
MTDFLEKLEGKWHILFTNFPMWLKGDKINPTFNYEISTKNGKRGLRDEVKYFQKGKIKSINGFDEPLNENDLSFEWRGNGLLSVLTSRWKILYFDEQTNWAIIEFEKTLFTPKGYDVICREKQPNELLLEEINKKVKELNLVKKLKKL